MGYIYCRKCTSQDFHSLCTCSSYSRNCWSYAYCYKKVQELLEVHILLEKVQELLEVHILLEKVQELVESACDVRASREGRRRCGREEVWP